MDHENNVEDLVDHHIFDFQLKTIDLIHELQAKPSDAQQKTDSLAKVLCIHQQKCRCESLYADGCVIDAALSLLEIVRKEGEDVIADWLPGKISLIRERYSIHIASL